jgi:hypothetical protein
MQSDLAEVRLVRWPLPTSPKDAPVGEGTVRGRILDGARPSVGATVSAGKGQKPAVASGDGAFELRLPSGPWVLAFRRAGAPDGATAELKVIVPAGGTVDMGAVQLAAPRTGAPAQSTPPVHHEPFP